jgi:hypothetical protein
VQFPKLYLECTLNARLSLANREERYYIYPKKWDNLGARYLNELESEKEKVGVGNNFHIYMYPPHSFCSMYENNEQEGKNIKTSHPFMHGGKG